MVVANKGLRPILATGGVERVIKLWDVNTGNYYLRLYLKW